MLHWPAQPLHARTHHACGTLERARNIRQAPRAEHAVESKREGSQWGRWKGRTHWGLVDAEAGVDDADAAPVFGLPAESRGEHD